MPQDAVEAENRFRDTLLEFQLDDRVLVIDLRQQLSRDCRELIAGMGPRRSFAVITAANPMGEPKSDAENGAAQQRLLDALLRASAASVRVDGVSPDRSHREPGFATWLAEQAALALAKKFGQIAFFWFDGERFWLAYCGSSTRVPLPIQSVTKRPEAP